MMAEKLEDPLDFIYEDIADHFMPNHFKDNYIIGTKILRHERYKITGFRVLIPVAKAKNT
jgi:hypothetical protein